MPQMLRGVPPELRALRPEIGRGPLSALSIGGERLVESVLIPYPPNHQHVAIKVRGFRLGRQTLKPSRPLTRLAEQNTYPQRPRGPLRPRHPARCRDAGPIGRLSGCRRSAPDRPLHRARPADRRASPDRRRDPRVSPDAATKEHLAALDFRCNSGEEDDQSSRPPRRPPSPCSPTSSTKAPSRSMPSRRPAAGVAPSSRPSRPMPARPSKS